MVDFKNGYIGFITYQIGNIVHDYHECMFGENFCRRKFLSAKKTIAKISVGKSKVTEIFATEIFAPKVE